MSKAFKVLTVPALLLLTGDYPFQLGIFYYLCLKELKVKVGPQFPLALMKVWDVWRLFKAGTFSGPTLVLQLLLFFWFQPCVLTQPCQGPCPSLGVVFCVCFLLFSVLTLHSPAWHRCPQPALNLSWCPWARGEALSCFLSPAHLARGD